jgi:hypothetical protein
LKNTLFSHGSSSFGNTLISIDGLDDLLSFMVEYTFTEGPVLIFCMPTA